MQEHPLRHDEPDARDQNAPPAGAAGSSGATGSRSESGSRSETHPRSATLPRSAILRGRNSFGGVFDAGNGTRVGRLVVKYRVVPLADGAPAHGERAVAGFVMRRGSGGAVRRNRLKRLMREAYRLERRAFEEKLPDGLAVELVVLWSGTREEAPRERLERLRSDLASALRKIVHRLRSRQDERSD